MLATYQFILMFLNETSINSALELSQNSIHSLNQLTTIITITFIPLSIILAYTYYMYFSLKYSKDDKIHVIK